MSDLRLSEVKLLHTVQYQDKSAGLKFADRALWLASAALGYEDLTFKKTSADTAKEPLFAAVKKVQNCALRILCAVAAIITLPLALIGIFVKLCLKNKQVKEIQNLKDKALPSIKDGSTASSSKNPSPSKTKEKEIPTQTNPIGTSSHSSQTQGSRTGLDKEGTDQTGTDIVRTPEEDEADLIRQANDKEADELIMQYGKDVNSEEFSFIESCSKYLPKVNELLKKEFTIPTMKKDLLSVKESLEAGEKEENGRHERIARFFAKIKERCNSGKCAVGDLRDHYASKLNQSLKAGRTNPSIKEAVLSIIRWLDEKASEAEVSRQRAEDLFNKLRTAHGSGFPARILKEQYSAEVESLLKQKVLDPSVKADLLKIRNFFREVA